MDNNNMRIIKHKSQDLYTCSIYNISFTSPNYNDVAKWRDDNAPNAEYYKEIKQLHNKAMQCMYNTNPTNYTGD